MGGYEPDCRSLASEAAQMQVGSHICPALNSPACRSLGQEHSLGGGVQAAGYSRCLENLPLKRGTGPLQPGYLKLCLPEPVQQFGLAYQAWCLAWPSLPTAFLVVSSRHLCWDLVDGDDLGL